MAHLRELLFCLSFSVAQAVLWNGAVQTNRPLDRLQMIASAPETTRAPRALKRRDDTSPQFCGWLWGATPWSCDPFSTCLWRTDISAVGCCRDTTNMNTCRMYTTCVNYSELGTSTSTPSDSLVLRCTDTANPICGSLRFEPSYFNWACTDRKYFWDISLQFGGASTSQSGRPRYAAPITSSLSSSSSSTSPPSSTSSLKPSSTIIPIHTTSSSPKSHTGAIVGGSVGGIAAVCAIAFGVILFARRRRNARAAKLRATAISGSGTGLYHRHQ